MMLEKCELMPCARQSRTMSRYVSGRFCPFWAASRVWRSNDSTPTNIWKHPALASSATKLLLAGDLRIALDEELQPEPLVDHGLQQRLGLGYLLKLSEVNMIVRTPAALAARRLARVVAMLWLRIRRPAILMTEQKLQRNGQPRAG